MLVRVWSVTASISANSINSIRASISPTYGASVSCVLCLLGQVEAGGDWIGSRGSQVCGCVSRGEWGVGGSVVSQGTSGFSR